MNDPYQIKTLEALREVVVTNKPQTEALDKRLYHHLDEHAKNFIAEAPLVFFGTADQSGHVDLSPKGDAPGFVEIEDDKTLLFPERMGNTDARNLRNILQNSQVSLVFVIPRTKYVLRVTGRADITKDPALLERMVSCRRPAQLCIRIAVEESFFHCGRAFNRSHLWQPDKWPEAEKKHMQLQMIARDRTEGETLESVQKEIEEGLEDLGESDGAY